MTTVTAPVPTLDPLTIYTLDEVAHVGTLDPAHRKTTSYEGVGLSVSEHPEDWAYIARLGEAPTWTLSKPDNEPLRFVSWHDLTPDAVASLRTWGQTQGWVEQRTVFRVCTYDCELEDTTYSDYDDEQDALAEACDSPPQRIQVWRPTQTFPDARTDRDCDPTDVLLAHWVRTFRADLDGVWWHDHYDPIRLSCPRGVLVHPVHGYTLGHLPSS